MVEKKRSHLSSFGYCCGASVRVRLAVRFASSVPVEGFKYGAAADGCDNPSRVWVEQLPLKDLLALRRPGQPWWRRCTPFTWALSVVAAALLMAMTSLRPMREVPC